MEHSTLPVRHFFIYVWAGDAESPAGAGVYADSGAGIFY
jgi:hypothetical protein